MIKTFVSKRPFFVASLFALAGACSLRAQPTYTSYNFKILAGSSPGNVDGTGSSAQFLNPEGIAVDQTQTVYIADSGNRTIRKISPDGTVTTLAGTAGVSGSADGIGASASFGQPVGIAVNTSGTVFVSDAMNNNIRKITPDGAVTTFAGAAGTSGSNNGVGKSASFANPQGIAVDSSGNLYVADKGNNLIRKIAPDGTTTTFAGSPPGGFQDGTGTGALFEQPSWIALDQGGNLYVTDWIDRALRKVTPQGVTTTIAEGSAVSDQTFNRLLTDPVGIAADAGGNLFVSNPATEVVERIDPSGLITTIRGLANVLDKATPGIGPNARFEFPNTLSVGSNGTVYVVDTTSCVVLEGTAVPQSPATITIGDLFQSFDGTPKMPTISTTPSGLPTLIVYSFGTRPPTSTGSFPFTVIIDDPSYTGSATGTLTIGPGASNLPPFTTRHTVPGGSFLWGIAAGPPGLVTVGVSGSILSSSDGITWTSRASGTTNWLLGVTYGAGQFVVVGDNGCILTSPDGASWTTINDSATTARLNNVAYGGGKFVAVGESGAIITSSDARNWVASTSGLQGWLRGLAYVPEYDYTYNYTQMGIYPARFIAAGEGGTIISSVDGRAWAPETLTYANTNPNADLESIAVTNTVNTIAAGTGGITEISSYFQPISHDGGAIQPEYEYVNQVFDPIDLRGLVQGSSALYASGDNGTILTAADYQAPGVDQIPYYWSQVSSGTTSDLVAGVAVGDAVFFVGDNETILESTPVPSSRLTNLSCRSQTGAGANALIAGFAVGGSGTTGSLPLLIRASGPALAAFGVPGVLADPDLGLFSTASNSSLIAGNSGWGGGSLISNEAKSLGAFAWNNPASLDAALSVALASGPYTANVIGASGDSGVALAEIYDATPDVTLATTSPRLINLSARADVGTGGNALIAGFVIGGSTPKTVLIRASGPALKGFGLVGFLPDPTLQVYSTSPVNFMIASNTGWTANTSVATAAAWVGAFSWGSIATSDSALLLTLPPGTYTANVTGASGDSGISLIEVYEVQ